MTTYKTDIHVYAHWLGMPKPKRIGVLSAQQAKGKKSFSFEYDSSWIDSQEQLLLDPDITWYKGKQYPNGKENFGMFLDSMPDTWGRTLMIRRTAYKAKKVGSVAPNLYDTDFLLGVHDESRMGALRFKLHPDGPFLDNDPASPAPPWATIRELQHAAKLIESNKDTVEVINGLSSLITPGSSLGGARPKANVQDEHGQLWIAKFPSANDTIDKAAWEFLAYRLAINASIGMSPCSLHKIAGKHHTFFTQRFDRKKHERIHFASAMTMTGKNEATIKDNTPGYLDIAEFIQYACAHIEVDLKQLWRRILFNIAISNTDDHLRNHGFILTNEGWRLSPAYDINPSIDKDGLALNIDMNNNALDFDLAKDVGEYFRLNEKEMKKIIKEVTTSVSQWKAIAKEIGISKTEQLIMENAFRF